MLKETELLFANFLENILLIFNHKMNEGSE